MEISLIAADELDDFIGLVKVFEEVFEMKDFRLPDRQHLQRLLGRENFIALVAKENAKVVGGLTVYILEQYYNEKPLAYIYDLAVLEEYQRKGVGKELVAYITNYCRERGFEEVFVQADKIDDYAIDFYRKTKPTAEEDVSHFYYTLTK